MSYRNPGDVAIANPLAFMEAFDKTIAPYKAELKKKAEERKEKIKKYDTANAALQKAANYPAIAKTYGKDKANAVKALIEDKYIKDNVFASASASEQQEMIDDMQMNVLDQVGSVDAAMQIDLDEVLDGDFDDEASAKFKNFLANKPEAANSMKMEYRDGELVYVYSTKEGENVLKASEIPDTAKDYKGKGVLMQEVKAVLDTVKNEFDKDFKQADDLIDAKPYLESKSASIIAGLTPRQKAMLFENLQIDYNGDEEGTGGYSYADIVALAEKDKEQGGKLMKMLDEGIAKYVINQVELDSSEVKRINSAQREKLQKAKDEYAKELREQGLADAKTDKLVDAFYDHARTFGFNVNNAGVLTGQIDLTIEDNIKNYQYALRKLGYRHDKTVFDDDENLDYVNYKNESGKVIQIKNGMMPNEVRNQYIYGVVGREDAAGAIERAEASRQSTDTGDLTIFK
jgi:hypothetical protein